MEQGSLWRLIVHPGLSAQSLTGIFARHCSQDVPWIVRCCRTSIETVLPFSSSVSRAEVLDIMHARRFEQVPIVDEKNRVIGLHLLHDIVGNVPRPNWAVVMAGGQREAAKTLH